MTVYVDQLQIAVSKNAAAKRLGERYGNRWCHMMADSDEELERMARRIGLKPQWRHGDHYDLTPMRRRAAVQWGAREVTSRELVELRRRKRLALPPA